MRGPLICRASGFGPLFAMFEAEQGAESLRLLRRESGFTLTGYSPSTLVPFAVMNRVYNLAAKLSGDSQFGARVAQNIRLEDFGPFVEYALHGETLSQFLARATAAQPLHDNVVSLDLRVRGGRARWRIRYRASPEPTVDQHAQRSLIVGLSALRRHAGAQTNQIEIHVADAYAAEARLLESRLAVAVRPRASDYALTFPAQWLDEWTKIASLPPDMGEALAAYRERPLPRGMADAVLVALELHDKPPTGGIVAAAAEVGMPSRTLQRALEREGATFREIARALRLRRARQLLATTEKPLAEVALRAGYTDPANFHRAFVSQTGLTPGRFREASRSPALRFSSVV